MKSHWPLSHRLLVSLRVPLLVAAGLSIYAALVDRASDGAVAAEYGVSMWTMVAINFAAALIAGAVIAAGGRWATSRWRGAVLGFVCGALVAIPFTFVVLSQFGTITVRRLIVVMVGLGVFPGSYIGALYWRPRHDRSPRTPR